MYKSKLQARFMHWAASKGKLDPKVVKEFDESTPSNTFKNIPEKKKKLKDIIKK